MHSYNSDRHHSSLVGARRMPGSGSSSATAAKKDSQQGVSRNEQKKVQQLVNHVAAAEVVEFLAARRSNPRNMALGGNRQHLSVQRCWVLHSEAGGRSHGVVGFRLSALCLR